MINVLKVRGAPRRGLAVRGVSHPNTTGRDRQDANAACAGGSILAHCTGETYSESGQAALGVGAWLDIAVRWGPAVERCAGRPDMTPPAVSLPVGKSLRPHGRAAAGPAASAARADRGMRALALRGAPGGIHGRRTPRRA